MTSTERLTPVPLREMWPHEAADFTPWLADNIDLLGEALKMSFEEVETEAAVGAFSADVVAETDRGEWVLIENLLAPSDHGHLGQLITYAAGIGADHAVLVAESLRDEHRTALDWLNTLSEVGTAFFGIEVSAWRIAGSPPAPQLRIVVQPDNWRRTVRATTTTSLLKATYAQFWAGLLPHVHEAEPRWRGTKTPRPEGMMSFKAAIPSVKYLTRAARTRLTAQCYIDTGDPGTTREVYDHLHAQRDAIEEAFGAPLKWRQLDGARASTIDADYPDAVNIEDRDCWDDMWAWLTDAMGRLAAAIDPVLSGD